MNECNQLSDNEVKRYLQQISLPGIGPEGQLKLKQAKILCIGAGGLATPLLLYLASSGVGTIGIVDDDVVELSNLHRQILYGEDDINCVKVESAKNRLSCHNSQVNIHIYNTRIAANNAEEFINQYDIVADCSDNFATRFLLNDFCFKLDKPLVSASIFQFQGQCMTMCGQQGPCLRCLFPMIPRSDELLNCEQGGVLGVLPGLLGMIQAIEIIKYITQLGDLLLGRVLMVDILKMQFREFTLLQDPDCDLCAKYRIITHQQEAFTCSRRNITMQDYIITPSELNELMKNNNDIELVDVRTLDKHQSFNIGGKHIPTAELPERFNELNPNKLVVTYCTSGGNSMRALQFLLSVGFKSVKSLDGGMTAWQIAIK